MRKPLLLAVFAVAGLLLPLTLVHAGPGLLLLSFRYKGGDVSDGGTIKGTVTLDAIPEVPEMVINKDQVACAHAKTSPRFVCDKESKGLGNVVVYLDGIQKGKKKVKGDFVIDQKNCHYVPHISIVPARSTLKISSSDNIMHNVHAYKGTLDQPPLDDRGCHEPCFQGQRCGPGQLRQALGCASRASTSSVATTATTGCPRTCSSSSTRTTP